MKKEDVPQQGEWTAGCREVNYAIDERGRYSLELSSGWEAKNIALRQAWEQIEEQLRQTIAEVHSGRKSPLAYHMVKHQMDPALLAQYAGISKWRVKRHLQAAVFEKLKPEILVRYAELFRIDVETLCRVPDQPNLPLTSSEN